MATPPVRQSAMEARIFTFETHGNSSTMHLAGFARLEHNFKLHHGPLNGSGSPRQILAAVECELHRWS